MRRSIGVAERRRERQQAAVKAAEGHCCLTDVTLILIRLMASRVHLEAQ